MTIEVKVRGLVGCAAASIRRGSMFFKEGNKYASKEGMSPEAHERRMAGLRKTWEQAKLKSNGVKLRNTRGVRKMKRTKLRMTLEKELREIQAIARTHADQAMQRLAEIVNDDKQPASVQIVAAQVILNRAYGAPTTTNVNANIDANGKASEITGKELANRIDQALKRVEAVTGRVSEEGKSEERPADLREPDRDPNSSTKH